MSYINDLQNQDPKLRDELADEHFVLNLVDQLHRSMLLQGLKKADLAKRLGWSRPAVTHFFDASGNIGVRRLRAVARALNSELVCQIGVPIQPPKKTPWQPVVLGQPDWRDARWVG